MSHRRNRISSGTKWSPIARLATIVALGGVALVYGYRNVPAIGAQEQVVRPAPAFTHRAPTDWINSPPIELASLRGKVVLIDVWTFECWNCYRSIPWLKQVEQKYSGQGLQLIGVHTPEFKHERERAAVEGKVKEFGIKHPVMMDNDFSYWNALKNRYWPAYYVIDRQGNIRGYYVGEMHAGQPQARAVEAKIEELLREPAASGDKPRPTNVERQQ